MTNKNFSLADMPLEINTLIFAALDKHSILMLRFTCHTIKQHCDNLPEQVLYRKLFESRVPNIILSRFHEPERVFVPSYRRLVVSIVDDCRGKSTFYFLCSVLFFAKFQSMALSGITDFRCPIHHAYHLQVVRVYRDETGETGSPLGLTHSTDAGFHPVAFALTQVYRVEALHDCNCPFRMKNWRQLPPCNHIQLPGAGIFECPLCLEKLQVCTFNVETCQCCHNDICGACAGNECGTCHKHVCDACISGWGGEAECVDCAENDNLRNECNWCGHSLFRSHINETASIKTVRKMNCNRCGGTVCYRATCSWDFECEQCHCRVHLCYGCHDGVCPNLCDKCQSDDVKKWCYTRSGTVPRSHLITDYFSPIVSSS